MVHVFPGIQLRLSQPFRLLGQYHLPKFGTCRGTPLKSLQVEGDKDAGLSFLVCSSVLVVASEFEQSLDISVDGKRSRATAISGDDRSGHESPSVLFSPVNVTKPDIRCVNCRRARAAEECYTTTTRHSSPVHVHM